MAPFFQKALLLPAPELERVVSASPLQTWEYDEVPWMEVMRYIRIAGTINRDVCTYISYPSGRNYKSLLVFMLMYKRSLHLRPE